MVATELNELNFSKTGRSLKFQLKLGSPGFAFVQLRCIEQFLCVFLYPLFFFPFFFYMPLLELFARILKCRAAMKLHTLFVTQEMLLSISGLMSISIFGWNIHWKHHQLEKKKTTQAFNQPYQIDLSSHGPHNSCFGAFKSNHTIIRLSLKSIGVF